MPRVIGCQDFAGGITLGFVEAGFDYVGKRELPGGFGVESVDVNRDLMGGNGFDIQVGAQESWTALDVEVVAGCPPCSGFSQVSDRATTSDRAASINECMWSLVRFGARCAPPVVAYESVQGAHRNGMGLLRALRAELEERTGARYTLYHVLHDAQLLGGAAQRRRYFWVASRIPLGFSLPDDAPRVTLRDAIGDLEGLGRTLDSQPYAVPEVSAWAAAKRSADGFVDGHVYAEVDDVQYAPGSSALLRVDAWEQGRDFVQQYRRYLEEHDGRHPPGCDDPEWRERFPRIFNGSWQPKRWAYDRAAYVVTGGSYVRAVHPVELRGLSLRELFRVQGFPDAWRIQPLVETLGHNATTLLPGKGIPVESGRWLATMVKAALDGEPRDDGTLVETGEREYTWKRNGNARRGKPTTISGVPKKPGTTTRRTKEPTVAKTKTDDGARELVAEALRTRGYAAVDLNGLADGDAKRARELLYSAAYGMDRKVAVRTDKQSGYAIGILREPEGKAEVVDRAEVTRAVLASRDVIVPSLPEPKAEPAPAPEPEAAPVSLIEPFEGFGVAQPPYADGMRHSPGDGTHWRYDATANAWTPLTVPEPPHGREGVWRLNPDKLVWEAVGGVVDRDRSAQRTIACPNPDCRAQVIVNPEAGTGRLCRACGARLHADGTLAELEDTADERESAHELDGDAGATPEALKQPKTSKREIKDRRFDLTQLREQSHGYYVHRDYAAHYFRWGWASRHFISKGIKCLDIGSGQDLPLARCTIYANRLPSELVCVDLNRIEDHVQPKWLTVYDETDVTQSATVDALLERHGQFDMVTNFEVIEHMGPKDGDAMLAAIKTLLKPDGYALISTPVFNGRAAANHVHEYEVDELRAKFEAAGFRVEQRWGTFGSYHDIRRGVIDWFTARSVEADVQGAPGPEAEAYVRATDLASDLVLEFYEDLREYYGDDVLACFMAPNLPDHARNNVWKLTHADATDDVG